MINVTKVLYIFWILTTNNASITTAILPAYHAKQAINLLVQNAKTICLFWMKSVLNNVQETDIIPITIMVFAQNVLKAV